MTAAPVLPSRPLTLDDVTRLAEDDETHRYELSEGNLITMPPPTVRHGRVIMLLVVWFMASRYRDRIALEPGVRTATDNLSGRIPDVVVTTESVPGDTVWMRSEKVTLAIEVVSRGSERADRWTKPLEYAAVGIPHFWRVELDETVLQFELRDGVYAQTGKIPLADLLAGEVPDLS